MSPRLVTQATLKPDGTLELDDKIAMPPGRVLVTVEPVVQPAPDDPFWALMERIWAAQKARGQVPRTREEIDTEINVLRNEAEEEIQAAIWLQNNSSN